MSYTVQFAPEAVDQLAAIEDYLAHAGSALAAARYADAIVTYCESLVTFPQRGIRRDDLKPGLRVTNHRRNAVIAYIVDADAKIVSILGPLRPGIDELNEEVYIAA